MAMTEAEVSAATLEVLGLSQPERDVYLALFDSPGASVSDIAQGTELSRAEAAQALRSLQAKGLATLSPKKVKGYFAAPPEPALEVLILRREEELQRVRVAAVDLMRRFRSAQGRDPLELVEVVSGVEGMVQCFRQLQLAASEEVLAFDRPPYMMEIPTPPEPGGNLEEEEKLHKGVHYRIVYEREALLDVRVLAWIEYYTGVGEEARIFSGLPMKLDIFDRRVALMPFSLEESKFGAALVVHAEPVVAALTMLFERIWEQATPFGVDRRESGARDATGEVPDESDRRLLRFLASGLKDQAIARQFNIDVRSVRRRVSRLLAALGAGTRFEAGAKASKRGWI